MKRVPQPSGGVRELCIKRGAEPLIIRREPVAVGLERFDDPAIVQHVIVDRHVSQTLMVALDGRRSGSVADNDTLAIQIHRQFDLPMSHQRIGHATRLQRVDRPRR